MLQVYDDLTQSAIICRYLNTINIYIRICFLQVADDDNDDDDEEEEDTMVRLMMMMMIRRRRRW